MKNFEKKEILTNTLLVKSRDVLSKKNIDGYLKYLLKNKYEGKCNNNGYIYPDSLDIVQRSIGKIVSIDRISYIKYEVTYEIKSIIPCVGDVFKCIINSNTRMGVVGFLDYKDNTEIDKSPLLFIVPKEFLDENKNYKIGDTLEVKILDIRIKFMSDQMIVIAEEFNK